MVEGRHIAGRRVITRNTRGGMDYYDELGVTRAAADVDFKKACVPQAPRRDVNALSILTGTRGVAWVLREEKLDRFTADTSRSWAAAPGASRVASPPLIAPPFARRLTQPTPNSEPRLWNRGM